MSKLTTQQIGRCGELLVQYMLLKYGIESAPLTTDTGIDLVAYPRTATSTWPANKPITIQVKTSTHHGTTDKWVEWNFPDNCLADYVATVDIERNKLWLFEFAVLATLAKRAGSGHLRLWWSLPGYVSKRSARKEADFKNYEVDAAIPKLLAP